LLVASVALMGIGCSELVIECEDPEGAGWNPDDAPREEAMLDAVNARREAGAECRGTGMAPTSPLVMNDRLRCAARSHSLDMAAQNYFAHDSLYGHGVAARVARAGYSWSMVSENLSGGFELAEDSVQALMESTSGHCENIMDPDVVDAGIGLAFQESSTYLWYWTQVFGRPSE
jgi:uncharacterized protein YkwD